MHIFIKLISDMFYQCLLSIFDVLVFGVMILNFGLLKRLNNYYIIPGRTPPMRLKTDYKNMPFLKIGM